LADSTTAIGIKLPPHSRKSEFKKLKNMENKYNINLNYKNVVYIGFQGACFQKTGGSRARKSTTLWVKKIGFARFNRVSNEKSSGICVVNTPKWVEISRGLKTSWLAGVKKHMVIWDEAGTDVNRVIEYVRMFIKDAQVFTNSIIVAERFLNGVGVHGESIVQKDWMSENGGYWEREYKVEDLNLLGCEDPVEGLGFHERLNYYLWSITRKFPVDSQKKF